MPNIDHPLLRPKFTFAVLVKTLFTFAGAVLTIMKPFGDLLGPTHAEITRIVGDVCMIDVGLSIPYLAAARSIVSSVDGTTSVTVPDTSTVEIKNVKEN